MSKNKQISDDLNKLETKDFKDLNQIVIDFKNVVNEIFNKELRAALMMLDVQIPEIELIYQKIGPLFQAMQISHKLCIIDFNLFETKHFDFIDPNILYFSFRAHEKSSVNKNIIKIGFDLDAQEYLLFEIHMIYLFERILFQLISDFQPSLVFLIGSSNISRNHVKEKFIFSGDCTTLFYLLI